MDDEDAPPELVDVTALPESLNYQEEKAEEREKKTGDLVDRVPITLVTGRQALSQPPANEMHRNPHQMNAVNESKDIA